MGYTRPTNEKYTYGTHNLKNQTSGDSQFIYGRNLPLPDSKVQYSTEASTVGNPKEQGSPRLQKIGRFAMNLDIKKGQIK
jgi:hypothetical protein